MGRGRWLWVVLCAAVLTAPAHATATDAPDPASTQAFVRGSGADAYP